MNIAELIRPESVALDLQVANKYDALEELSRHAARRIRFDPETVFCAIIAHEVFSSTAIGMGVAVPHARFRGLHTLIGCFARLARPVDFGAIDRQPVDLVFLLLGTEPADKPYVNSLVSIAKALRIPTVRDRLRGAKDAQSVCEVFLTNGQLTRLPLVPAR